jgi:uncharacterized protein
MSEPPRYVPDCPLPPYTYIPGRSPHPVSDPAGHQHGRTPQTPDAIDAATWATNRFYLFGIDLFNHGFYWEAHEAWESLWHKCGRRGTDADFLKGLIHLAAAGVKGLAETPRGVLSHSRRAAVLLRIVAAAFASSDGVHFGLRLADLIALAETTQRDGWTIRPTFVLSGLMGSEPRS